MAGVRTRLSLNDGMTPALRHINNAMKLMLGNFEAVQRASGKAVNVQSFSEMRAELDAADARLNEIESSYRNINDQQEKLNRKISTGASGAGGLLNKIKGIAAAYVGINSAKQLVGLSDTMSSATARLDSLVDDNGSVEDLKAKIYASAQSARAGYTDAMDTVSKLGITAGKAFDGTDEIIKFTEILNKNFVVGGASATEQASAMYQLTQAMSSGRLQGDEYRSIIENAPLLAKSIEDYMVNVKGATGTMKEWASEGQLTADVIKAAVFNSASDVEERFEQIPVTWSQVWTDLVNRATVALDPLLQKINALANDDRTQNAVNSVTNVVAGLSRILGVTLGLVVAVYSFIANNWGWIGPIIGGIVAAIIAYNSALLVNNTIQGISAAIKTGAAVAAVAHGTATVAEAAATTGMTSAQIAFNAALWACPLTWIMLIIIAIIALIYVVIGIINKVTGSSVSATGIIVGALAAACAFIWNLFLALFDLLLGGINYLVNPWIAFANFFANLFNDPVGAVIHLFGDLADNVLGVIETIARAIDKLFGSNLADAVSGWREGLDGKINEWASKYGNGTYEKVVDSINFSSDDLGLSRWAYTDAWNSGYNAGENLEGMFNGSSDPVSTTSGYLNSISDDTSTLADTADKTQEELSYLRDIAEQEAINRFTTAEVKIDMTGMTNRIDGSMDIDGVVTQLTDGFVEALTTASEGVHEDGI